MFLSGLLETSLSVGVVILMMLILSVISKGKYRGRCQRAVWLLLSLRLMVPISSPAFPQALRMEIKMEGHTDRKRENTENPEFQAASPEASGNKKTDDGTGEHAKNLAVAGQKKPDMGTGLLCIWLGGMAVFIICQAVCYAALRRKITKDCRSGGGRFLEMERQVAQELGLKRIPDLRIWPESRKAPFLTGIAHPCLVIPEITEDEADLYYIFKHELVHYARKDLWVKLLLTAAHALHWFNPAVWLMRSLADTDVEIACDGEVTKQMSMDERKEYIEVILACVQKSRVQGPSLSTGYLSGIRQLKIRFANILDGSAGSRSLPVTAGAVCLCVLCGAMVRITEAGKVIFPIDYGIEVRTDLDGDGDEDRVRVYDIKNGDTAFTQVVARADGMDAAVRNYPGRYTSHLVCGDLSGDGTADIMLVSVDGPAEVVILRFTEGRLEEYPSRFIPDPAIPYRQPDHFERECWRDGECLICGATILEKDGRTMLRFIMNTDEAERKQCIDASWHGDGWLIEDMRIIESYYRDGYCYTLLENSYDYREPGQTDGSRF